MSKIVLRDLEASRELDRQAMAAIMGSGLWGSIKKYSRKAYRYAKKKVKSRYRQYREAYHIARSAPGMFYSAFRSFF